MRQHPNFGIQTVLRFTAGCVPRKGAVNSTMQVETNFTKDGIRTYIPEQESDLQLFIEVKKPNMFQLQHIKKVQ